MLTTYHYPVPLSRNLGNLTSCKPYGPVQACNGTALPFYYSTFIGNCTRARAHTHTHTHTHMHLYTRTHYISYTHIPRVQKLTKNHLKTVGSAKFIRSKVRAHKYQASHHKIYVDSATWLLGFVHQTYTYSSTYKIYTVYISLIEYNSSTIQKLPFGVNTMIALKNSNKYFRL